MKDHAGGGQRVPHLRALTALVALAWPACGGAGAGDLGGGAAGAAAAGEPALGGAAGSVEGGAGGVEGEGASGGVDGGGGAGDGGASGGSGLGGGTGGGGGLGGGASGGSGLGGGAGGASGGGGGAGGSTMSPPVVPALAQGRYRFAWDDTLVEVDPERGARVVTYALGGKNVLTGPAVDPRNWGSTFWPSPQSAWGWPPPAEIDELPYVVAVDGDTLVLRSRESAAVRLVAEKRFRVDRAAGAVVITHVLLNTASAPRAWAGWQVTRVPPGGLSFFELGPGGTRQVGTWTSTPLVEASGWRWFDDSALQGSGARKTFADGTGWLAHVERRERLLLVKVFDDVPVGQAATDEAEIELFVDGMRRYVEVEAQGPSRTLAPGESVTWTVRWMLRALSPGVEISPGSMALVQATRALLR